MSMVHFCSARLFSISNSARRSNEHINGVCVELNCIHSLSAFSNQINFFSTSAETDLYFNCRRDYIVPVCYEQINSYVSFIHQNHSPFIRMYKKNIETMFNNSINAISAIFPMNEKKKLVHSINTSPHGLCGLTSMCANQSPAMAVTKSIVMYSIFVCC